MQKIYHLSTCNTCQRIIQEINPDSNVQLQDINYHSILILRAKLYLEWGQNHFTSAKAQLFQSGS